MVNMELPSPSGQGYHLWGLRGSGAQRSRSTAEIAKADAEFAEGQSAFAPSAFLCGLCGYPAKTAAIAAYAIALPRRGGKFYFCVAAGGFTAATRSLPTMPARRAVGVGSFGVAATEP